MRQCGIYKLNLLFRDIHICCIFYMIHQLDYNVAHIEVTVWRRNKYISQPRDRSLSLFPPLSLFLDISVPSISYSQYLHLPGFLFSTLFRFLGTLDFLDFSNSTFCSQTRKHHSLIFSLVFLGSAATQLNLLTFEPPNWISSHGRHEDLTLK